MQRSRSSSQWTSRRGGEGDARLWRLFRLHEGQPPCQGDHPGRRGDTHAGRRCRRAAVRVQAGSATRAERRGAQVLSRQAICLVRSGRACDRGPILQDHDIAEGEGPTNPDQRRLDRGSRDGDRRRPRFSGQSLRTHRPGRMGESRAGLRAAGSTGGMTACRTWAAECGGDVSGDWRYTTVNIHRRTPGDWSPGPRAGGRSLSGESADGAASTPRRYISPGTTTAWPPTGSRPDRSPPAYRSRCARAAVDPPTSWTTGWPSTSPGRWGPRRSGGRSHWRTFSFSAARVTGARPGWTAGSRGSSRPARMDWRRALRVWRLNRAWADVFLAPMGMVDAGDSAAAHRDIRTAA